MPVLESNGTRINYLQTDCVSGDNCEDLVMVHGLSASLAFWYPHAQAFAENYRVTLFDLRGHGQSGMPEQGYTPRNMAQDLRHLLEHLDIQRFHCIAHSFGGAVVLHLACSNPDLLNSLILADTHISAARHLGTKGRWCFGKQIQPILQQNGIHLDVQDPYFGYRLLTEAARLQVNQAEISQELKNLFSPFMGKNSKRTAKQWLRLMEITQAEQELMGDDELSLAKLQQLYFPILALYGEHSQAMATGVHLLNIWPHACFRRIRNAGHFFPVSRAAEFIKICSRFWKGEFSKESSGRMGETANIYFRSDRFYSKGEYWFFITRESPENGPFSSRDEAEQALLRLSQTWRRTKTNRP